MLNCSICPVYSSIQFHIAALQALDLLSEHLADIFSANLQEPLALPGLLLFERKLHFDAQPAL